MRKSCTGWKSWLSGEFTLAGKRQRLFVSPPAAPSVALALLLVFAHPAMARSQIGPTSSGSVSISVSVAPKIGLGTIVPPVDATAGPGSFCLTTNGRPMALPVMLVWTPEQPTIAHGAQERAEQLRLCNVGGEALEDAVRRRESLAPRLFIIRPE